MKKFFAKFAVLVMIVGALFGLSVTSASANVQCSTQGTDTACASHGYTVNSGGNQEHRVITVQDNECDGHATRAKYRVEGQGTKNFYVEDQDGCGGNAYTVNWVSRGLAITWLDIGEYSGGQWNYKGWLSIYSHTDA